MTNGNTVYTVYFTQRPKYLLVLLFFGYGIEAAQHLQSVAKACMLHATHHLALRKAALLAASNPDVWKDPSLAYTLLKKRRDKIQVLEKYQKFSTLNLEQVRKFIGRLPDALKMTAIGKFVSYGGYKTKTIIQG